MKNKIFAFTITETIITLGISAIITILVIGVIGNNHKNVIKYKLKKGNFEFKTALNNVISNPVYYSTDGDLANMDAVKMEDSSTLSNKQYSGTSKFRGLLLNEMGVQERDPIECFVMGTNKNTTHDNCYKGADGLVWGIPNTDFEKINVVTAKNASGSVSNYVPITLYPEINYLNSEEEFKNHAIIYGVRRDGAITVINNVDCSSKYNKKMNQCRYAELITTVKTN